MLTLLKMTTRWMSCCGGYIELHIDSESDTLFEDIMSDVLDAELRDISDEKAIEYALDKNKDSILATVNSCDENEEDTWFWCKLAAKGGGRNCQWFTGKPCYCIKCKGQSILVTVMVVMKIFIGMRDDKLIQHIEADIANKVSHDGMELVVAIDQVNVLDVKG